MSGTPSSLKEFVIVRNMNPEETRMAAAWAADEGWNPGFHDIGCHYSVDPKGWFVAEYEGRPVGIVQFSNYDDSFSFGGFLVVRPEFRKTGIGDVLLKEGLSHTEGRICGADGVFEMQETYSRKYGFIFAYRNIRREGNVNGLSDSNLLGASDVSFERLADYDSRHFPVKRHGFLKKWIEQKESVSLVSCNGDEIEGFGTIRKCFSGYKIGPLFAENFGTAEKIFLGLCDSVDSEPVYLDTPAPNAGAVLLAKNTV
ncbi:GNAT superfamily N-acetyltransferase [Methanomicrobium sp. W14]|uniref:GNAT family N-acetyltransferase n=1 Tax=Methanomicrobium sp. W14 TaxID=2817839 RepID=UPI001FDA3C02|nr:GNAT family N-acetyltransferase [Methanomicrobium sp. W14]MBP2132143.1 GNAT superfamily N-acetyltransferase [Methanomicrobium sp. W14]